MVPSPPKIRMASASLEEAGRPCSHFAGDPASNGFRSAGDVPSPKMTAARMYSAFSQLPSFARLGPFDLAQGRLARRPSPQELFRQALVHEIDQIFFHLVVFGAIDVHHVSRTIGGVGN